MLEQPFELGNPNRRKRQTVLLEGVPAALSSLDEPIHFDLLVTRLVLSIIVSFAVLTHAAV